MRLLCNHQSEKNLTLSSLLFLNFLLIQRCSCMENQASAAELHIRAAFTAAAGSAGPLRPPVSQPCKGAEPFRRHLSNAVPSRRSLSSTISQPREGSGQSQRLSAYANLGADSGLFRRHITGIGFAYMADVPASPAKFRLWRRNSPAAKPELSDQPINH